MNTKEMTASRRAFFWTLFIVFAITVYLIKSFAVTIIMGGLLALLSYPAYRLILHKNQRPTVSAFVVTFLVILLALGPIVTFAGLAVKQAVVVGQGLAQSEEITFGEVVSSMKKWPLIGAVIGERDIEGQLKATLQTVGKAASKWVVTFAKNVPEGLMKFFLAGLTCFFFLRDGPDFLKWIYIRLPFEDEIRQRLTDVFKDTAISVVWATMAAAGIQAIIMTTGFLALDVPAAFFAGGVTFIFAFIPLLGSVPVWLSGSLYLLWVGSTGSVVLMLLLGAFTATIDNFIRPWILKGRNEMHPLVSLLAIIGGIETFGVPGVFLGPIIAALLITLLQIWPLVSSQKTKEFI